MNQSEKNKEKIENSLIEIELKECIKCKECVNACPAHLFYMDNNLLHLTNNFVEFCIECGHCVAICPVEIISLKNYEDLPEFKKLSGENFPSYEQLYNLVLSRRSIRQFKDTPVPQELFDKILGIARYSPTASNSENIFYTILKDKNIVSKISKEITKQVSTFVKLADNEKGREILKQQLNPKEYEAMMENYPKMQGILEIVKQGIDFWCWDAELIIIHGERKVGGIPGNTALAAAHIMLAAKTLDLATCSLGYLTYFSNENKKIRKLLNIPKKHKVGYSLSIGFPKVKYKRIPSRKPLDVNII
jgi:nitroreductase/NAD-dependent dihydropyrimidine dehydrogenase PreA subunit